MDFENHKNGDLKKDAGTKRTLASETFRPFELVKNFTSISLVFIFTATLCLSVIISHRARVVLLQKSEDYALLLANNLNHQVFMRFILPTALQVGRIQLRKETQFRRMDEVVRGTMHGFNVDLLNIYDLENTITYSFDQDLVGRKMAPGIEYQQAISGKSASRLVQSGPFWSIMLGVPEESKLRTYTPLFLEKPLAESSSRVLGVFEIVQDLSEDYRTIFNFQLLIIGSSASVMLVLFLILRLYVQRGEAILLRRAEERLRLEEQLSQAERLAALGEMGAVVSHEIRNPLGIIRSTAELLKKRNPQDRSSVTLHDVIIEESTRLNDIITDFLNFARPTKPHFRVCRLQDILQKNLTFLSPRLEQSGYTIETHVEEDLPEIMADSNLLYQCFLNVIINAMQAMPDGGVIRIEATADEDGLLFSVTDQGQGVSEETLKKIWNPFYTTKERGTGLGLCIVRNIVEAHEGRVWMENSLDNGASAKIRLPMRQHHGNNSHR